MVNLTSNTFGASAVYLRGNNHVITNNIINTAFFLGDNIQGCNDTLMQSNTFAPGNLNINAPSISKASNLTIRSNTFTSSSFDVVVVSNAQNSFIAHNNIKSNDNSAPLTLADTTSGFTIYNNNFTSNKNVVDNGTNNKWNFTYEKSKNKINGNYTGGNYYSTYTGLDDGTGDGPFHNTTGDGIGDNPNNFTISGTAKSVDYLPLTNSQVQCDDNDADGFYADCKAGACCTAEELDCDDSNKDIRPAAKTNYNSNVTFCTGTYNINPGGATVITFIQNWITIDCNGSTIIGQGTGYAFRMNGGAQPLLSTTIKNCNFQNYSYLADLRNSRGLNIDNINFTNTSNQGIYANNVNGSTFNAIHFDGANYAFNILNMHDNNFTNNVFGNNTEGQNILSGSDDGSKGNMSGNIIMDNVFKDNPAVGIGFFFMPEGNTIVNNTFVNLGGTPISFEGVNHTVISGNTILSKGSLSNEFNSCNNLTISNNTIVGGDEKGIDFDTTHNSTIVGNLLMNIQSDNAINLIDSYDNNITGNNVSNCSSSSSSFISTVTPRRHNGKNYASCIGGGGNCIFFQNGSTTEDVVAVDSDGDQIPGMKGTENYMLCLITDTNVGANSTWFVRDDAFADCDTWYNSVYKQVVGTATVSYQEPEVLTANGATKDYIVSFNASTTPMGGFTTPHQVVYYENAVYGIGLEDSCRNFIYDNYLNNGYNADDAADGVTCQNFWNIPKQKGMNIVGGPSIGGNYYSDYKGTDGDKDGIGDVPYNGIGDIADQLPLVPFASKFNFAGNTYDATGNVLANCTVKIEVWNFFPDFKKIHTYTTTSNGTGYYNLTGISAFPGPYGYKPSVTHADGNGKVDYVGKSLPELPFHMISEIPSFNLYLDQAGTINITAVNGTGASVPFFYAIKDTNLGFPVKEEWSVMSENVIEYVPLDRNYSVVIFPNMSFPLNYEINNLTDYSGDKIDLEFNTTQNFVWVSGYVKTLDNLSDFTNLSIISYITEPGNIMFEKSVFPFNMSQWRGDGSTDYFDPKTGFYNITLMGNSNGMKTIMLFMAYNSSGDKIHYIQYINQTLKNTDIWDNNVTVRPAAGSFNKTITINNGRTGGNIGFNTIATNFSLVNSTNASISTSAFLDMTIDYTDVGGAEFHLMQDVQADASGVFSVTLLADHGVEKMEVFTESAPMKTSLSAAEINNGTTNPPVYITVKTFEPGSIDGKIGDSDIEMRMFKSNEQCSVPNPPDECSKGDKQTKDKFDPMIMTLGGGKVDFGMKMKSTGIEVRYVDVDLLASGPPDAMFDSSADRSQSGSTVEEIW